MDVWLFSIASRVIVYSELQDYTAASRVLQSFHVLDEQALFSAVPLFLGGGHVLDEQAIFSRLFHLMLLAINLYWHTTRTVVDRGDPSHNFWFHMTFCSLLSYIIYWNANSCQSASTWL